MKNKYINGFFWAVGIVFVVGIIFSKPLLNGISQVLVYKDPLIKVEALVVLVGSGTGNRVEAAARLYHEGFADKLIFSGYEFYPGNSSSFWMKAYAIKLGVPEDKIITEDTDEEISTRGESIANLILLNRNHISNFILVTSAFHTKRSKLIYEKTISLLGYDINFLVYPADDPRVPIQDWWKVRTSQKAVFTEYLKLIAYYIDL